MKVIIFNYNLPEETEEIYNKLILDGFEKGDVIVVDNGSDKARLPKYTGFMLPKNIRFTGQSFMALTYLLDFTDFTEVLLITTSAKLYNNLNYYALYKEKSTYLKNNKIGYVVSSLDGGLTEKTAINQYVHNLTEEYSYVFDYQPIVTLVSRKLLEICRADKAAYFNLKLIRGWGIDRELQYVANKSGLKCVVSKSLLIEWRTNQAHVKGVADESVKTYRTEAEIEMMKVFNKKYGVNWLELFKAQFNVICGDGDYKKNINIKYYLKNILIKLGLYHFLRKFK
jgi:hypothetical protein